MAPIWIAKEARLFEKQGFDFGLVYIPGGPRSIMSLIGGPQLGEVEAGAVANWFGAPFSVISGGIGCLLSTGWVAWATPRLRQYRREAA